MVKHEIKKITRYEFWPFWVFYAPLFPFYLYYALRNRSLLYFCRVNPGMKYGGFFDYSKKKIQEKIPSEYKVKDVLITAQENLPHPFDFPFIAKPNIGERGKEVQIIENETTWNIYLKNHTGKEIIVQQMIDLPLEFGLFYAQPNENESGKILSVTGKDFLTLKGDGKTSLRNFIESYERAYFQKSYLYMKYLHQMDDVPPVGENWILEKIGNHSRGTYFYDASELITPQLSNTLTRIGDNISGFRYGRFDVKAQSVEALQNGEFIVIEANGANSEPTHIYDRKYTLFQAYKEVIRHLKIQQKIARQERKKGVKTPSLSVFIKDLIQHLKH